VNRKVKKIVVKLEDEKFDPTEISVGIYEAAFLGIPEFDEVQEIMVKGILRDFLVGLNLSLMILHAKKDSNVIQSLDAAVSDIVKKCGIALGIVKEEVPPGTTIH